jgi:Photosynthesis system II assembly factor YCF48/Putative zinc-finger
MRESGDDVKPAQNRDRALDEMLRRAMTDDAPAVSAEACLDAETAAAWMEDTLSSTDRAAAEAHAAGCPRCQAVLAAMARTETPAEPARAWWQRSAMRWLAPVGLAAAVGITVFVLIPREIEQKADVQVDLSKQAPIDAAKRSEPSLPSPPEAREGAASPSSAMAGSPVQQESKALRRRDAPKEETRQQASARSAADERAKDVATPKPALTTPPSPPPTPPPAATPLQPVAPLATPSTPPPAAAAESMAKANVQSRAGGAAGGVVSGGAGTRAPADALRYGAVAEAVSITREVLSPDQQSRWRIVPPATVEHSTDGGRTWAAQEMPTHAALAAATAPAPTVCWIVGKAGTVLLTVDGRTWQSVAFPETADLVSITAPSADAATVTTADGRTFSTTDRGRSWSRR